MVDQLIKPPIHKPLFQPEGSLIQQLVSAILNHRTQQQEDPSAERLDKVIALLGQNVKSTNSIARAPRAVPG